MPRACARWPIATYSSGAGLGVARRDGLLVASHLGHGACAAARRHHELEEQVGCAPGEGGEQVAGEARGRRGRPSPPSGHGPRRPRERAARPPGRAPAGRPRAGSRTACIRGRRRATPVARPVSGVAQRRARSGRSRAGSRPAANSQRHQTRGDGGACGRLQSSGPRQDYARFRRSRLTRCDGDRACGGGSRPYPPPMTAAAHPQEAAKPRPRRTSAPRWPASAPAPPSPGCPRTRRASSRSRSWSGRSANEKTRLRRPSRATSATAPSTRRSSPRSSSCSERSGTPSSICATGWTRRSARRASSSCLRRAASSTSPSASSGSSRRGTTRCRWRSGPSSPPSPQATAR